MSESSKKTKSTLLYILASIIPNAIGFITLPIYSRVLSPTEYGVISYTTSFTIVLTTLTHLCLHSYFLRFYYSSEDKKRFTGAMFGNLAAWNTVLLAASCIFFYFLFQAIHSEVSFFPYMFLALLSVFFVSFEVIPIRYFRLIRDAKSYFFRMVLKSGLNVCLMVIFLFVLRIGVLSKYLSAVICDFVFAVVFILYMHKHSTIQMDKAVMKAGLKFSLPILPSELLGNFSSTFLNLTITSLISLSYLGIYSIGTTMASVIGVFSSALIMTFEPDTYKAADSPDYARVVKYIKNNCFPIMIFISFCGGMLVREATSILLTDKYLSAWPIVQILVLTYPIDIITSMYYNTNIIEKNRYAPLVAKAIGLALQIISCLILFRIIGDSAFGWSVIIKAVASTLGLIICSKKKFSYKFGLIKDLIVLLSMYIIMQLSNNLNSLPIILCILLKLLVICGTFIIIAYTYHLDLMGIYKRISHKRIVQHK